ncbi:MAG: Translation initiation factor 6 [Methanonatronarchaeales archaeon]|nr:Translation initiation factor 6 [Methanonatronarchaeales archaeon]
MPFLKVEVDGDSNVGMYAATSEQLCVMAPEASGTVRDRVAEVLGVEVVVTTVGGASLVGALCGMNSSGAVVTRFASEAELEPLRETGIDVGVVQTNLTASGNVILANDYGALVHPEVGDEPLRELSDLLDVPVESGGIGPYATPGSAAVTTNRGMLLPGAVGEDEAGRLERFFGVPSAVGSVNYGVRMVGTGTVANSKGFVAGKETTGAEMGRMGEALLPGLEA